MRFVKWTFIILIAQSYVSFWALGSGVDIIPDSISPDKRNAIGFVADKGDGQITIQKLVFVDLKTNRDVANVVPESFGEVSNVTCDSIAWSRNSAYVAILLGWGVRSNAIFIYRREDHGMALIGMTRPPFLLPEENMEKIFERPDVTYRVLPKSVRITVSAATKFTGEYNFIIDWSDVHTIRLLRGRSIEQEGSKRLFLREYLVKVTESGVELAKTFEAREVKQWPKLR